MRVNAKELCREVEWAARFTNGNGASIPILSNIELIAGGGRLSITGKCRYGFDMEGFAVRRFGPTVGRKVPVT